MTKKGIDEILERLNIVKTGIMIDDLDTVNLQIEKISKLKYDDYVESIITKLNLQKYSEALDEIEVYLKQYKSVDVYIDPKVEALKVELKTLENKLQELSEKKQGYIKTIEEFNIRYTLRLGELIKNILELKKEMLYKQTLMKEKKKKQYEKEKKAYKDEKGRLNELKNKIEELETTLENFDSKDQRYATIRAIFNELKKELESLEEDLKAQEESLNEKKREIEDEEIEKEYEKVKEDYDKYYEEYEQAKEQSENIIQLDENEKEELKNLYRDAAKLCHPDLVPNEFKKQANEIMQELNKAYNSNDINKIREVLEFLKNTTSFEMSSDKINDIKTLEIKIKEIQRKINEIMLEIEKIEQDETYQIIKEIDDFDEYFDKMEKELSEELNRLKQGAVM